MNEDLRLGRLEDGRYILWLPYEMDRPTQYIREMKRVIDEDPMLPHTAVKPPPAGTITNIKVFDSLNELMGYLTIHFEDN